MTNSKPVGVIRHGRIRARIWSNDTEDGLRHSVTVSRRYQSGEEWKWSERFSREDLPLLIQALDEARRWMFRASSVTPEPAGIEALEEPPRVESGGAGARLPEHDLTRAQETKGLVISERFQLCPVYVTPGAKEVLEAEEIARAIGRHVRGDWGDVSREDAEANDRAVEADLRVWSVYWSRSGVEFWVVTEAGHSVATLLLPEEC